MLVTRFIFYPVVCALEWLSNRVLRLLGIDRSAASMSQYHTEEDLLAIVEESRRSGKLRDEAGKVVSEMLEFGSLRVSDVMVPRVALRGVPLGCGADEIAVLLQEVQHTRYPVYDGSLDQILGMVHIKDLIRLVREGCALGRDMLRPIPFVPENMDMNPSPFGNLRTIGHSQQAAPNQVLRLVISADDMAVVNRWNSS